MKRFPKILYWKWDEGIFNKLDFGLNECVTRFDFDYLYVSFHHLALPFVGKEIQGLIRKAEKILTAHGKQLLLDIDLRNELDGFLKVYPQNEGCNIRFWEEKLDDAGNIVFNKDNLTAGRTGRTRRQQPPIGIAGAWVMDKMERNEYKPGSLVPLNNDAVLFENRGVYCQYNVSAGAENAGKTLVVVPIFEHGIPDLFSENIYPYYSTLFDAVADVPLAGAATDEWGWDLALQNDDGLFFVEAFPYSTGFVDSYKKHTARNLNDDLIHLAYHPSGDVSTSVHVINSYITTLRKCIEKNNLWFKEENKRRFGADAFVGVHQTLWGDFSDFSVDIVHNGLCWWETPWEIPQTDEFVAMPIRTALVHKWGGPIFYNMWYSGNSQQLDTYWRETWKNARFGGRTHYLGYECPHEPGVFRLKHPGALEGVDEMERKITEIDRLQRSRPDCRVAVVFGMEAVSCFINGAKIVRGQGNLTEAVKFALALFEHCLCDFIPGSEIANGSLKLENGQAVYGSQKYDAVVYIEPEYMDKTVLEKLTAYTTQSGRLLLYGTCDYFNDGKPMDEGFLQLAKTAAFYSTDKPVPLAVLKQLDGFGVPRNRFPNGCVFQDGSLLFTANAVKPTGNILAVDVVHKGKEIKFLGEDYLYVGADTFA